MANRGIEQAIEATKRVTEAYIEIGRLRRLEEEQVKVINLELARISGYLSMTKALAEER